MPARPHSKGRERLAVVTGASTGIGSAFAARLAADGYDLLTVARNRKRLQAQATELQKQHGVAVQVHAADLTECEAVHGLESRIAADENLEILVNNAGFGTTGNFWELDPDREEAEIRLNILAVMRLTRAVLPGMVARKRGTVINVSSIISLIPNPTFTTYGATKQFINAFSESLSEELRGTGVRVQSLCPGFTRTEFQRRAGIETSSIPEMVWMEPEEVVEESFRALKRGAVLCIPGATNRMLANLTSAVPRSLLRRMAGAGGRWFFH